MAFTQQHQVGIEVDAHYALPFVKAESIDALASGENTGVEDQHVKATEARHGGVQQPLDLRRVSQIANHTAIIRALMQALDRATQVSANHRRAAREQCLDTSLADAGRSTRHQRHFAGEHRRLARLFELGLLQIPILDIENIA